MSDSSPIISKKKAYESQHLSPEQHVYRRPDTYIGSVRKDHRTMIGFDPETKKFQEIEVDTPVGVQRLFLEIIANAGDNADASRREGIDPGSINVEMNEHTISIENFGRHMPVKKYTLVEDKGVTRTVEYKKGDKNWVWLPAFNFGVLRSGTNYNDDKVNLGCGRNGYGSKLCGLFSVYYEVEVDDPEEKLSFKGVWKDNMFKDTPGTEPEITVEKNKKIKTGRVKVTWKLDFERFKMKQYSEADFRIFARFTSDFSFTCKVPTSFNGIDIDMRDMNTLAECNWSKEQLKNSLIHYVWSDEAPKDLKAATPKTQGKKIVKALDASHIPEMEIMFIDTPDESKNFFYVNGLMTVEGGKHVDAVTKQVYDHMKTIIKKKQEKLGSTSRFSMNKHFATHLSIIINARLPNPEYSSQSKTKLTHPKVKNVTYEKKALEIMNNWEVIQRVNAELEALEKSKLKKDDGKKKAHIVVKGEDANLAGTKDSLLCTLFLTEGDSASEYIQERIVKCEVDPILNSKGNKTGSDYFGYEPMKGKVLNVSKADISKYAKNNVISSIRRVMGLQEDMDYSIDENRKTLRYGKLIAACDSDNDGFHILSLIINFLREKYPSILQQRMFGYLCTPVVKVRKNGKIIKRFFSDKDFEKWRNKNDTKGLEITYYKGLGTSEDEDIEDDLKNAPTIIIFYDEQAESNLDLAFHKNRTNDRKEWIAKWRDIQTEDIIEIGIGQKTKDKLLQIQNVSTLINKGLIEYSVSSLFRAIPSEYDFLKEVQRKIIWVALKNWNYSNTSKKKEMKTFQFCAAAAADSYYHHGDKSMTDAVAKMAQDFVGANNLGYFAKKGQFGSRTHLGKKYSAPRYTSVKLNWWLPLVFQKESIEIIKQRNIEDELAEPEWLPSVIPIGLCNGFNGMATGFSTSSANYNPFDTINWIRDKLKGKEPKPLVPWYNGYSENESIEIIEKKEDTGEIEIEDDDLDEELSDEDKDDEVSEEEIEEEEVVISGEYNKEKNQNMLEHIRGCKKTMRTYGHFEIIETRKGNPVIRISELPIGVSTARYSAWLEANIQEKLENRFVLNFEKKSKSTNHPVFEVHWNKAILPPNMMNLKLRKSMGISNITLIDHQGYPKQYRDVQDVMEKYFQHMMDHYEDLKQGRINKEEDKLRDATYLAKYIQYVMEDKINIWKEKNGKKVAIAEDKVQKQMEEHEIPFEYYDKCKTRDFSKEAVEKHQKKIGEAKAKINELKKITPSQIWNEKLDLLEKEMKKRFKNGEFIVKKDK